MKCRGKCLIGPTEPMCYQFVPGTCWSLNVILAQQRFELCIVWHRVLVEWTCSSAGRRRGKKSIPTSLENVRHWRNRRDQNSWVFEIDRREPVRTLQTDDFRSILEMQCLSWSRSNNTGICYRCLKNILINGFGIVLEELRNIFTLIQIAPPIDK